MLMSKKKKIIFLISISFIILLIFLSVLFIKNARQDRTWPFDSGIKLPSFVKYYVYKYTNPESFTIDTHLYEINTEYLSIPSQESIGGGGSINFLNKENVLITLNNGNNWILDIPTKKFTRGPDIFTGKFLTVRDANVFSEKNEIALLVGENDNDCTVMKLKIYDLNFSKKRLEINNERTLWKSEKMCADFAPNNNNGGGRVVFYNNSYFISLGFLAWNDRSGVYYPFSQDPNSSFGKIIKIIDKDNSEIYSIGHRNPQGLFIRKKNNLLISTEHGPRGGDEINLITKNSNYGWPCKSIGTMYGYEYNNNSKLWPDDLQSSGCDIDKIFIDPLYSWTPSIGASQGLEYRGDEFIKMKDNLIISSLTGESLFRINLSDMNSVINVERIRINERIRDITVSPDDGKIVIYTDGGSLIFLSDKNR